MLLVCLLPNLWGFAAKKPLFGHETNGDLSLYAWKCQFDQPTLASLVKGLDPESRPMYENLRKSIVKIVGTKPKLEWMGLRWRWCELTSLDDTRSLIAVHLIADPENPRVALTLSTAFFDAHPPSKLPKGLHSGFTTAPAIGHRTWCEWPIGNQENADALKEMITLAFKG
ncbi:hypothetical protein COB72_06800 [bacterium]|nr:MAG: hypothetical protein COB72_06800 [bacterium]